ncbi:MAG: NADH-quinone oxidoreductase subunit NuoE [Ignavibacteriae bacterium]|nr:NADH-quinone oxidoreductase subunit NuoE [Ignavibacteriota bacterium]
MHRKLFEQFEQGNRSNLIGLLQDVQDIYGYVPEIAMMDIAEFLSLPTSSVYGVATFYNQFRLTPLGKNVINVCRGTACHVKDSANILASLENELGVSVGMTTRNKEFTLEEVACIGACSIAPVISINGEYFGRLKTKDIPKLIADFRKQNEKEVENSVGTE